MAEFFDIVDNCIINAKPGLSTYEIPAEVTSIRNGTETNYAFKSLKDSQFSVIFAQNSKLAFIGSYAFSECSRLISINLEQAKSLKTISSHAFSACSSLKSISFPSSLEGLIGYGAFRLCTQLTTISFPDDSMLTIIDAGCFRQASLTSIRVPKLCQTINGESISYCPLAQITVQEGNQYFADYNGSLYNIDYTALIFYSPVSTMFYPHPQATTIGYLAFEGYKYSLLIPRQFTTFETSFLGYCGTTITMMKPPLIIKRRLFEQCSRLKSIFFFDTVTSIESGAFKDSNQLKYVYFVLPISKISQDAFPNPSKICFAGAIESVKLSLAINIKQCELQIVEKKIIFQTKKMYTTPNCLFIFILCM